MSYGSWGIYCVLREFTVSGDCIWSVSPHPWRLIQRKHTMLLSQHSATNWHGSLPPPLTYFCPLVDWPESYTEHHPNKPHSFCFRKDKIDQRDSTMPFSPSFSTVHFIMVIFWLVFWTFTVMNSILKNHEF